MACFIIKTEETELYKKAMISYALLFIPSIAYTLFYKSILDSGPTLNPVFLSPESMGWPFYTYINGKYPVLKFWQYFVRNYYFGFALLCMIPLLISLKIKKLWKIYLLAPMLCLTFIFYNPFIMYLLKIINPGMDRVYRFIEIFPAALIVAGFLYVLSDENKWISRKTVTLLLPACFILIFPFINKYQKIINYTTAVWETSAQQALSYRAALDKYVKPGTRVFADPKIAWTWPTMFPHYLFMHPFFHGLPPNYNPVPRHTVWLGFFKEPLSDKYMESFSGYVNDMDCLLLLRATYEGKAKEIEGYSKYFDTPVFVNELGLVVIGVKHEK